MTKLVDEKYRLYSLSVQNPEQEIELIDKTYRRLNGRLPQSLREDFCGTFLNSVRWVQYRKTNQAIAVDIDPEPLGYGLRNNWSQLTTSQRERLRIQSGDVLTVKPAKTDVICALNFSYWCFQSRDVLRQYFKRARQGLKPKGIFIIDCFGGQATVEPRKETVRFPEHKFKYIWELKTFDLVNSRAVYSIHFYPNKKTPMRNAFTYDWRIWSLPEICEVMYEAGFKKTQVLLEGTTRKGTGNGQFEPTQTSTENCETWIAYIVGIT